MGQLLLCGLVARPSYAVAGNRLCHLACTHTLPGFSPELIGQRYRKRRINGGR